MANLSTYLKGELIKHIFRSGSFTKPSALYVALFVGATEVSGGSYARVATGPGDAAWADQVGGNGTTYNLAVVAFAAPSAAWGNVTAFKIFDAITGGNALVEGTLVASKNVNLGDDAPSFPIATLVGVFT